jgi:hypothetical protein
MDETELPEASEPSRGKLRFSIGQLLVVTAIVSVVLMVLATLVPPLLSLAMMNPVTKAFFDSLLPVALARSLSFPGVWLDYSRRLPSIVVWTVGVVVLVRRQKRHPRVSQCALVGLAGLLAVELARIGLGLWLNYLLTAPTAGATAGGAPVSPNVPPIYTTVASVYYQYLRPVSEATCWALILAAVLGWREEGSVQGAVAQSGREDASD